MGISIDPPGPVDALVPAQSLYKYNTATAPVAAADVAVITAPPLGIYAVNVAAYFTGTVTAADGDNLELVANGAVLTPFLLPAIGVGAVYCPDFNSQVLVTSGNLSVRAIANGGVACIYHVLLTATRIG